MTALVVADKLTVPARDKVIALIDAEAKIAEVPCTSDMAGEIIDMARKATLAENGWYILSGEEHDRVHELLLVVMADDELPTAGSAHEAICLHVTGGLSDDVVIHGTPDEELRPSDTTVSYTDCGFYCQSRTAVAA